MPRVPLADNRVQVNTPNIVNPVQTPAPPQEAFGVGTQQAVQNLGQAIEKVGTVAGKHLIQMEQRESQRIALEIQNNFHDEINKTLEDTETDDQGVPKGYLNRKMNQANGASVQFDAQAQAIYQKYKAMQTSPELRNQMDETLRSTLGSARERVIRHEASERDSAAKIATETFITKSTNAAAVAPDSIELSNIISSTQGNYAAMMAKSGLSQEDIAVRGSTLAGNMTKAAVEQNLETNPLRAKKMLEDMNRKHGPLPNYADLKKTVDGKIDFETELAIWNKVKDFKRADGTVDSKAAEEYVYKLPLTAEKKQKFASYVNARASVADANLREAITANDRSYANELVQLHAKGASFDEALALATQRGRDMNDITEKQEQARQLFAGKESAFDTWVKSMPQEYQSAAEYAEQVFKSTYPQKNDTVRIKGAPEKMQGAIAAIEEFKQQAIGKSPSQMRQLANEMVKDVVVKPGMFWDTKEISWKVSAENRLSIAQATAKLENDYGVDRVARAKSRLRREGIDVNPFNIKALLDKATPKEGQ